MSEKGLAKLDCSELVAVYLAKLGAIPNMVSLTTWNMTTKKDFRKAVNSNDIDFIAGSNLKDFIPQRGDIFIWRRSDAGHCGIVYKHDAENDLVTILEALDKVGSADKDTNKNNGSDPSKGCTRVAVYLRIGKALFSHAGWKGYFRPKNYTKKYNPNEKILFSIQCIYCDRWGEIVKDKVLVGAMVDRLTHKAHLISMNGQSHRVKETEKMISKEIDK